MSEKINFSRALKFLPKIEHKEEEKNVFPNRQNFHYKRTFSKFLTNKLSKEHFFYNTGELNISSNVKKKHRRQEERFISPDGNDEELSNAKKTPIFTEKNFVITKKISNNIKPRHSKQEEKHISSDGDDYQDEKFFSVIKKTSISTEKRSMMPRNKKKQKQLKEIQHKNNITRVQDIEDEELRRIYCQSPMKGKINYNDFNENRKSKHVIDLNFVSNYSRLSEHYMRPYSIVDRKECLSDMNLIQEWPSSTMYKNSFNSNSWVNSFKAKAIANEINKNYCDTNDSSRLEYVSFTNVPKSSLDNRAESNLKNNFESTSTNSRIFGNNSRLETKSVLKPFLPNISYCQKQLL